ncbi:MAG: prolyl oligopeptidase family serine peptidase [Verrucomicrobiota bacterium]|nr:prolyl oligopeptidase family serine peptidase [Verrucomicrobiota bacterium]
MKKLVLITSIAVLSFAHVNAQNSTISGAEDSNAELKSLNIDKNILHKTASLNSQFVAFVPKENPELKVPLIIYLHGAGGKGDDLNMIKRQVMPLLKGIQKFTKEQCIVVAPQCLKESRNGGRGTWKVEELNLFLEQLKKTLPMDANRIYLTGNSFGGYGAWLWGGHNPEHFAAILPIVGGIGPGGPKDVTPDLDKWAAKLAQVPVYAFAGKKDRVVPAERSERMVAAIRKAGGDQAEIKVYPNEAHGAKRTVLSGPEFYQWMFSKKRGNK